VPTLSRVLIVLAAVLAAGLASCGTSPTESVPDRTSARAGGSVRVVAVGDIACPPGAKATATSCRQAATARLARRIGPAAVLALGDLQYQSGGLAGFEASYDASWGSLRSRTLPVPGNHEYETRGAAGYYTYFAQQQPGAPGWYVRGLGRWRAYLLNSNCGAVDCAAEARWLTRDLKAHPRRCSLIVTHHPRWSSGEHGNNPAMGRFFRIAFDHHVELFLSGHDHDYERFRPKRPDGSRAPRGVVQLVAGTGGRSFYPIHHRVAGSAYHATRRFGVLQLTLADGRYSWVWKGIGGARLDAGSRTCT
jgi:alkaline phosphatase